MNHTPQNNLIHEEAYPAIYDFSLLPYALGDVLSWSVKECIKAINAKKKFVDVYLCADDQSPSGMHQKDHIDTSNYQIHLFEVLPAFFCNPMLRNLHVFVDRPSFGNALKQLSKTDVAIQTSLAEHENALLNSYSNKNNTEYVIKTCSTQEDINEFYKTHHYFPKLVAPKASSKDAVEFLNRLGGDNKFFVAVNFRTRNRDQSIPNAEPERNADFSSWYDFIKLIEKKYPDVVFLLLGKVQEKPLMLLRLSNVITPRLCGFNLSHELALVTKSDCFMGSISGFALMAYDSGDKPYLITKLSPKSCNFLGIANGEKKLPFAQENQILVYEEESADLLLSQFEKIYNAHKRNSPHPSETLSFPHELKTSILFNTPEAVQSDLNSYVNEHLVHANTAIQAGNFESALSFIDRVIQESPNVVSENPSPLLMRAFVLFKMKKFSEAKNNIEKALTYHPLNEDMRRFRAMVELAVKQNAQS